MELLPSFFLPQLCLLQIPVYRDKWLPMILLHDLPCAFFVQGRFQCWLAKYYEKSKFYQFATNFAHCIFWHKTIFRLHYIYILLSKHMWKLLICFSAFSRPPPTTKIPQRLLCKTKVFIFWLYYEIFWTEYSSEWNLFSLYDQFT